MTSLLFQFVVYIRCFHLITKGPQAPMHHHLQFVQQKISNKKIEGSSLQKLLNDMPYFNMNNNFITFQDHIFKASGCLAHVCKILERKIPLERNGSDPTGDSILIRMIYIRLSDFCISLHFLATKTNSFLVYNSTAPKCRFQLSHKLNF